MKRFSILILVLISLNSIAQVDELGKMDLKKIFLTLPDTVFSNGEFVITNTERNSFWTLYEKGKFDKKEVFKHGLLGKTNLDYYNDSLNIECFIEEEKRLIRVMNNNSDIAPTYEIKAFNSTPKVIGITLKYSDHVSLGTTLILFYKRNTFGFENITSQILGSFNYFIDNYSDSTIKILNEKCGCDLKFDGGSNKGMLYSFTTSDTVLISDNFYGYFFNENPSPGIDTTYFDGEFYTKKYIMENGKLRLAE